MKTFQKKVDSSAISSYEYDDETLELDVKFKSGVEYRYYDVDEATFERLQLAESKGSFIATEIKKFEYEKLGSVSINKPQPWNFPKAKDFAEAPKLAPHGANVAAAWPFPTGNKP